MRGLRRLGKLGLQRLEVPVFATDEAELEARDFQFLGRDKTYPSNVLKDVFRSAFDAMLWTHSISSRVSS